MDTNLLECATEFTTMHSGYTIKLSKRSDSVTIRYYHNYTEYTHKVEDEQNHRSVIPEDATILYNNQLGAGKWVATIKSGNTHGYVTNEESFINWACRNMHQFDRILLASCVFDTPEMALNASQQAIAKLDHLTKNDINELSRASLDDARSKFDAEGYALPMPPVDREEDLEFQDDNDTESTFFFIAHGDREKTTVTVIDLDHCVNYERHEFRCIDDVNFRTAPAAIKYAKEVARLNGLKYEPFDTRYYSEFREVISE